MKKLLLIMLLTLLSSIASSVTITITIVDKPSLDYKKYNSISKFLCNINNRDTIKIRNFYSCI